MAAAKMSSRYQKPYTIPEEFPPLLKQFTREVLREQPENLYAFGATYFKKLLELKRDEERKWRQALSKGRRGAAGGGGAGRAKAPPQQRAAAVDLYSA